MSITAGAFAGPDSWTKIFTSPLCTKRPLCGATAAAISVSRERRCGSKTQTTAINSPTTTSRVVTARLPIFRNRVSPCVRRQFLHTIHSDDVADRGRIFGRRLVEKPYRALEFAKIVIRALRKDLRPHLGIRAEAHRHKIAALLADVIERGGSRVSVDLDLTGPDALHRFGSRFAGLGGRWRWRLDGRLCLRRCFDFFTATRDHRE